MLDDGCLPQVMPAFDLFDESPNNALYQSIICNSLKKMLPDHLYLNKGEGGDASEDFKEQFRASLPLLSSSNSTKFSSSLSICLLTVFRANASKFFFEMISNWLIPGHRLNDVLFYAVDFFLPEIGKERYTFCEIIVNIKNPIELETIQRNLPILETEIKLGVTSAYYARRILEVRGMAASEKTALILEHLAHIVKRLPDEFDYDVFTEMQHVLVMCSDEFKFAREARHLSRIISIHYYFRKLLREALKIAPEKRHLNLKLRKAKVRFHDSQKTILGMLVGMNFLGDKEVFEERHLLKAVQNYLPNVHSVEGSFFSNRRGVENICTLYLEIEKNDGSDFAGEEIQRLQRELPSDLKDRIEHLMHPIFMPRNEEEVMRNILSLSNQIKYLRDPPHVFITFDEQTHSHLFFTVILVRALKGSFETVPEIFQKADTFLEYIHDWQRTVGYLRKKYPKEATVFRVKLPKEMFLRDDHSIDLCKARQVLVEELARVLGPIRDYNGGMISKQNELLCCVRTLLAEGGIFQDFLLENFFYSLTPAVMRTILDPNSLRTLFLMMLEGLDQNMGISENYILKIERELDVVFAMIIAHNPKLKEEMSKALSVLNIRTVELATVFVNAYDTPCLGYIYTCDDPYNQEHFCQIVKSIVEGNVDKPVIIESR